jgi:hypothetical protein
MTDNCNSTETFFNDLEDNGIFSCYTLRYLSEIFDKNDGQIDLERKCIVKLLKKKIKEWYNEACKLNDSSKKLNDSSKKKGLIYLSLAAAGTVFIANISVNKGKVIVKEGERFIKNEIEHFIPTDRKIPKDKDPFETSIEQAQKILESRTPNHDKVIPL